MTTDIQTTDLVFVYGSLMRTHWNHYLIERAEFRGEAAVEGFELYENARFPMVVEGGRRLVHGEVFRVTARELATLDRLEGVDVGMYRREARHTLDGRMVWIYVWGGELGGLRRVESGAWREPAAGPILVVEHVHTKRIRVGRALDVVARMRAEPWGIEHDGATVADWIVASVAMIAGVSGGVVAVPDGETKGAQAAAYLELVADLGLVALSHAQDVSGVRVK